MYINKLIDFCDIEYSKHPCPNGDKIGTQSCTDCLAQLHQQYGRHYNCKNMIPFYYNKFIFKYHSEIQYLLEKNTNLFSKLESFKVVSIGCGPSTELLGFLYYLKDNKIDKTLYYLGIDSNPTWELIHNKIREIISNRKISITYIIQDFRKLNFSKISPNILILQYCISDIYKNSPNLESLRQILNSLIDIISYMEKVSYVILNDVDDPEKATNHFEYIFDFIKKKYPLSKAKRCYFLDKIQNDQNPEYGNPYNIRIAKREAPPEMKKKYKSYFSCSSAQMLIQVNK